MHLSQLRTHYSSGRIAAFLIKIPPRLTASQRRHLEAFFRFCPQARQLRKLSFQFRALLRWPRAAKLTSWLERAMRSGFDGVAQFAKTLSRDLQAVELAIETPWSNGPVEGHINRLKAIKRQMSKCMGALDSNCCEPECCPGTSREQVDICAPGSRKNL